MGMENNFGDRGESVRPSWEKKEQGDGLSGRIEGGKDE